MNQICISRLTHTIRQPCKGIVHSVFSQAVNVAFEDIEGQKLLTLVSSLTPALPDSLCIPDFLLKEFQVRDKVLLDCNTLIVYGKTFPVMQDSQWDGRIKPKSDIPDLTLFLKISSCLTSGFDRLPIAIRNKADVALQAGDYKPYLGLGCGLTPSFDDASIGAMAVCYLRGEPVPHISDLSMTTDVSARYLRLAMKGYFSQPILDVIDALYMPKRLVQSMRALQAIGATSGSDTIYGMRKSIENKL